MHHDKPLWTELDQQGRMVTWLAKNTGIALQRLYDLRHRGGWWRHDEAEAVSRALGVPRTRLFGPAALVLPPGRRKPKLVAQPPQHQPDTTAPTPTPPAPTQAPPSTTRQT